VVRFTIRAGMLIGALAWAQVAGAQIMRRPVTPKPVNWVGVNLGIVQGYTITDGSTNATWSFGSGIEYGVRLEHSLPSGISIGAQAAFSDASLGYSSASCANCDAKANVRQLVGLLHFGRGYSFHPVYELAAGAIGYSNFSRADDGAIKLGTNKTDYDFKLSLGYGLGFGVTPSTSIEIIQEFGTVLHQRDGLSGSSSSFPRVYVTRLGGKATF
jgi:hypothetical protein